MSSETLPAVTVRSTERLAARLTPGAATFLVGDVGGTNCRLALAQASGGEVTLAGRQDHKCADFPDAQAAIERFLHALGWDEPLAATVLAIAGPVRGGVVRSTNMHWRLSEQALAGARLGRVRLINDYAALALSVARLARPDLRSIGPDLEGETADPVAVIGAGTGFGAAVLARGPGFDVAVATEGGHVAFAPSDEVELEILRILMRRHGRVSVERLLSGPGLTNLRRALAEISGAPAEDLPSEDIVRGADAGDALSRAALDRFCAIYGSVAGDFALAYGARGGVFLGGGIAPAIASHLARSAFRERFEAKGRFQGYMRAIPTRIILNTSAALVGAAYLAQEISAGAAGELA